MKHNNLTKKYEDVNEEYIKRDTNEKDLEENYKNLKYRLWVQKYKDEGRILEQRNRSRDKEKPINYLKHYAKGCKEEEQRRQSMHKTRIGTRESVQNRR